jgi:hypothetical protein
MTEIDDLTTHTIPRHENPLWGSWSTIYQKGSGGPQKPFSWLSEGVTGVFTINTETGEIVCVLHLKVPNVPTRGRDTVKREVREEQEKNKDTLVYGPMDEAQADADPEVGGLKRSNTYVLLVLQLAVGMAWWTAPPHPRNLPPTVSTMSTTASG